MQDAGKILIIDDEANLRASLGMILERAGYVANAASNAQEALDLVRRSSFNLVFLDLNMPGMHGMQLLPELRKIDSKMAVIILTGEGSYESAHEAIKWGARGYLLKPINPWEIVSRVAGILREEQLIRQRGAIIDELNGLLPELKQEI